jgi:apolipoprotein N-acyltransferase
MPKKGFYLLLAMLCGVLLFLGWPPKYMFPFLFVGMVPLFYAHHHMETNNAKAKKFFIWYVYFGLLVWNILTTWWVGYAHIGGGIAMLLANTALMIIPFSAYIYTKRIIGENKALMAFVLYWLAFEYLHLTWEISYPWLTLGNGLAMIPWLVQWYEYTGILGGSLWILSANVLVYKLIVNYSKARIFQLSALLLIPTICSVIIYTIPEEKAVGTEVLVVQPNIDPYNKFKAGEELEQVDTFLALAEKKITTNTRLMVLPETAIVEYLNESDINNQESILMLKKFIAKHPQVEILTGAATYRFFEPNEKISATARDAGNGEKYDSYNTALLITKEGVKQIYHKSKLVPGAEKMPYPQILGFLEYFSLDLGGISGSLGIDKTPVVFKTQNFNLTPGICYESIYGDHLGKFSQMGSNVICIITNDGWWENTDGYKQHLNYGRLRAIELRAPMVRCANTGISCYIDTKGNISHQTKWWQAEAFLCEVKPSTKLTFYARSGNAIGRMASFIGVFFLLSVMVKSKVNAKKSRDN